MDQTVIHRGLAADIALRQKCAGSIDAGESKKTKDKHEDYAVYVITAVLIICVIAAGVIAKIKNRIMK